MKQNCTNYGECRRPAQMCNDKCEWLDKTCWNCIKRIKEECADHGHEVYEDSVPCEYFCEDGVSHKATLFLNDLRDICRRHSVLLSTSGYDGLQIWDLDKKANDPIHAAGIDDMTGERSSASPS